MSAEDWRGLELGVRIKRLFSLSVRECQEKPSFMCLVLKKVVDVEHSVSVEQCEDWGSDESEDWDSDLDRAGSRSASTRSWERGARSGRSASWMGDDERLGDAEAGHCR